MVNTALLQKYKVSIVTPSYNQGRFLERTVLSIVGQDYEDIEYIVMDGGSTDGSKDILRKHEENISYWVSQPDNGQADAINKGFEKSHGEILAWINSDDFYLDSNVISRIVRVFEENPDVDIISARCINYAEDGKMLNEIRVCPEHVSREYLKYRATIIQPGSFFRRHVFEENRMDVSLNYIFDWDFFIRASGSGRILYTDIPVAGYTRHKTNKTATGGIKRTMEIRDLYGKYLGKKAWQYKIFVLFCHAQSSAVRYRKPCRDVVILLLKAVSNVIYFLSFKRIIRI